MALGLAADGASVGLLGRSRGTLDAVLRDCAALGAKAVAVPADVTDRATAKAARRDGASGTSARSTCW